MKKMWMIFLFFIVTTMVEAQVTGRFVVNGDINNYYPVVFLDNAWGDNVATELTLGRSQVHADANWRGALIAKFRFHTTEWGAGANFIDADVRENTTPGLVAIINFVGGWVDATQQNGSFQVVIWLRGGTTTYFYTSNYAVNPTVYDGVQNALPFQIANNGGPLSFKTTPDSYVNINGINVNTSIMSTATLSATGTGNNYFAGTLSVGTGPASTYALSVNGAAIFTKAVVKAYPWSDYVFDSAYRLAPLGEVEKYIRGNHHLPEVPSADSVEKNGIDIGNNQAVLLKKIEELTLYLIEQKKELQELKQRDGKLEEQEKEIRLLKKRESALERELKK